MEYTNTNKRGISLIVLVITIIIMIVLSSIIILSLSRSGIIGKASKATLENDIAIIKQEAELLKGEAMLTYQSKNEVLTQEKLIEILNNYFEGSEVNQNVVTVKDGRYLIIVNESLQIKVEKNTSKVYKRGDVKASFIVAADKSIYITMELVGMPKYDTSTLYSKFEKNTFLEGKKINELLEIGGEILYPDLNLDSSQVYDGYIVPLLKEKTNDVPTYTEYIADADNITKKYFGYNTAEEHGREVILEIFRNNETFKLYGSLIEYAKEVVPELVGKGENELIREIMKYCNNEMPFEEILKASTALLFGTEISSLDQAEIALNTSSFGIQEERGYIFSREQILLVVASTVYSQLNRIQIKDSETTEDVIDWYMDSDMKFELTYTAQKLETYEITITSPSGSVEKIKVVNEPDITIMLKDVGGSYIEVYIAKYRYISSEDVKEYRYFIKEEAAENYTLKATTQEATYKFEGLTENKRYNILVEAVDKSENVWKQTITTVSTVPVPKGFTVSRYEDEDTVGEGLVIYKTNASTLAITTQEKAMKEYDQFVWVPVTNMDDFKRTAWVDNMTIISKINDSYTEPSFYKESTAYQYATEVAEYNKMRASVEKYGGFYIGRYEAGDGEAVAERTTYTPRHTVVSRKGAYVYNYVCWGNSMTDITSDIVVSNNNKGKGAVYLSQNMYNEESTKNYTTNLIYAVQWDATLRWLSDKYNVTDSRSWGNYYDSVGDAAIDKNNVGMNFTSGRKEAWKTKNIYDLAGNLWEWTMESYIMESINSGIVASRVKRGGSYLHSGIEYPVMGCTAHFIQLCDYETGFRTALYLK